jgi:outer membrane receptor for ferrienterochelin and colicin
VRLNGQTNFRVLLNGRETAMFAQNVSEALQGFPSATIVKIEVITNPSARYDAEGIGGIINIITKKKIQGYNGSLSTWSTTINQHVTSANFNAKFNKVGIAVTYGTRGNYNIPSGITNSTYTNYPCFLYQPFT